MEQFWSNHSSNIDLIAYKVTIQSAKCKEKNDFSCTVSIGVGSPSCNKEGVEKYWQSNGRPNFVIKDFFIEDILYGTEENDYEPIMTKEEFINTLK